MAAAFETPPLGEYPVIPLVREGAMAHSRPFVAKPELQKPLGFPGELAPGWEKAAVLKLGELVGVPNQIPQFWVVASRAACDEVAAQPCVVAPNTLTVTPAEGWKSVRSATAVA